MHERKPQAQRLQRACSPEARRRRRVVWVSLFLILLPGFLFPSTSLAARARTAAPARPKGVTHVVGQGETLFRISQAYGVKVALLVEANHLKPSVPLRVGQRLFIPGATAPRKVELYRALSPQQRENLELSLRDEVVPPPPAPPGLPQPHVRTDGDFLWPIVGAINSPFGPRWGKFHAGIDIASPHYQEVVASADGEVIYAGDTRAALGKAVVLRHGSGFRTVYAHLAVVIAHEGDTVRQGQAIAGVGDTGRATGPHLHFEVRRNGTPVNPEDYLPATIDELVRDLAKQR